MRDIALLGRSDTNALSMCQCGFHACSPGYTQLPIVREFFLILYVIDGFGKIQVSGRSYSLSKGQGIIVWPRQISLYQADNTNPWTYYCVGVCGYKAEGYLSQTDLSRDAPVFTYDKDDQLSECMRELVQNGLRSFSRSRELLMLSFLCRIFSILIENSETASKKPYGKKEFYIDKVIEYIEKNYSAKVSISDLSRYIGLDKSYMGSIFKEAVGVSPQHYLNRFRITKACSLMQDSTLSFGDIGRSVGYPDPLQFSKAFKKLQGASPSEYRKKLSQK